MEFKVLKRRSSVLLGTMMISSVTFAQKVVTGHVIDEKGDDVVGATVRVKGTTNGAATNINGGFSLSNVLDTDVLEISYVGYDPQKVSVGKKNRFEITLAENGKLLNETVVVGYGVMKKSDVTGAMVRVGEKELKAMPISNALEGMQGKAAGVDITSSQRPGEIGTIRIRGERSLTGGNEPLYVLDGVIMQDEQAIAAINPADIVSVDILKDASATAIYGSRGANGVVIISTNRGESGKVKLNYSSTVRFDWLSQVGKMMTASEWLDYSRFANYTAGNYASALGADGRVVPVKSIDQSLYGQNATSWKNVEQAYDANGNYDPSKLGGYDWADDGKQTGITNEHNISISGGTDKFNGYASFGYLNTKGVIPGQNYTRYTGKVTFDAQPLEYFKMGGNINVSYRDQDYGYSFTKSVTGAGDYYNALTAMLPWTSPYDENGNLNRNPNGDVNIINPIDEVNYTVNNRKNTQITGSFFGELDFGKMWQPLEGLRYRINFGPEFRYAELGTFNNKNGINGDGVNKASWTHRTRRAWSIDNLLYYDRAIGKHKVGLTLGQSASAYHRDWSADSSNGVAKETELWYNMFSGTNSVSTDLEEMQMTSYLGRLNYNYDDRYLATFNIRRDASSVLSDGRKWDTFPSLALGWRINNEEFMSSYEWVDQLKLRVGLGIVGNSAIQPYQTLGAIQGLYYQWGGSTELGYVGSDASAKNPNMMGNKSLKWERTRQLNIGLDFSFINNRINGVFDVYSTKTDDLLSAMSIPSVTGYTKTMANVGKTKGWGIDLQLNGRVIDQNDLKWDLGLTWSLDRTEIVELANGIEEDINNKWFVGEQLGVYYDYVYDGVWKTAEAEQAAKYNRKVGQIKVKDLDDNGKIDGNDRQIVGTQRPDWSGGLTSNLTYKNWDFSIFVFSRWGFTVLAGAANLDGRYMQRSLDYFIPGVNEDAEYYQPGINGQSADAYQSSMNYQDGSFIKVRNINLGYTFNKKQLEGTGLGSVKVYAQVMNPFSIYRATDWLDTDLVSYDNNVTNFGSMTTQRSFVLGLKLGF